MVVVPENVQQKIAPDGMQQIVQTRACPCHMHPNRSASIASALPLAVAMCGIRVTSALHNVLDGAP